MLELRNICAYNVPCNITLAMEEKGIYGILGEDCFCKTAIAQIICGVTDTECGEVLINGERMCRKNTALKKKVRLVSPTLLLDGMSTSVEYLDFVGDVLGMDPDKKYRQIKDALELVGIDAVQNKIISSLNASEKCRLGIAASLIGNPEIIVFDEPFTGISETALTEIYQILDMLGKIKSIVLLSHKPEQVKRLCEYMAVISDGKIVLSGKCSEIEQKINKTHTISISVRGDEQKIHEAVKKVEGVVSSRQISTDKNSVHTISVEYIPDTKMKDKLFLALSQINVPMLSYKEIKLTLSDVYYSLTHNDRENKEQ